MQQHTVYTHIELEHDPKLSDPPDSVAVTCGALAVDSPFTLTGPAITAWEAVLGNDPVTHNDYIGIRVGMREVTLPHPASIAVTAPLTASLRLYRTFVYDAVIDTRMQVQGDVDGPLPLSELAISWGDGSDVEVITFPASATGTVEHVYPAPGDYTITIEARFAPSPAIGYYSPTTSHTVTIAS